MFTKFLDLVTATTDSIMSTPNCWANSLMYELIQLVLVELNSGEFVRLEFFLKHENYFCAVFFCNSTFFIHSTNISSGFGSLIESEQKQVPQMPIFVYLKLHQTRGEIQSNFKKIFKSCRGRIKLQKNNKTLSQKYFMC